MIKQTKLWFNYQKGSLPYIPKATMPQLILLKDGLGQYATQLCYIEEASPDKLKKVGGFMQEVAQEIEQRLTEVRDN